MSDAPGDRGQGTNLRSRIITAAVGLPVVAAAVLWPGGSWPFAGWPFALLVLVLLVGALREFYNGCRTAGLTPRDEAGMAAALLLWFAATPLVPDERLLLRLGITLLVVLSLVVEALRADRAPMRSLGPTWLGALYIGWLFPFTLRLRLGSGAAVQHLEWLPPAGWVAGAGAGAWLVLFTMLVTAAVDTGAYAIGKTWGKHKLAPTLSPGKTWEGALGGFAAAVVVAFLLGTLLRLPMPFSLAAGGLIGLAAQLGDLSKSAIKREIGIKDFGTILPGHGGVLDRFDSLLFTAPAVYWLVVLWDAGS